MHVAFVIFFPRRTWFKAEKLDSKTVARRSTWCCSTAWSDLVPRPWRGCTRTSARRDAVYRPRVARTKAGFLGLLAWHLCQTNALACSCPRRLRPCCWLWQGRGASDLCNCTCSATPETLKHVYLSCPHYAGRRVELSRHVDAWRAGMLQRGVVRSRAEAMAWVHTDLGAVGAPRCDDTARVRRELRQAAWSFWRSTRRHKEPLPVSSAALCPCHVSHVSACSAAAAPASRLGLRSVAPAYPRGPPPPPQPMPSTGRMRHKKNNKDPWLEQSSSLAQGHPALVTVNGYVTEAFAIHCTLLDLLRENLLVALSRYNTQHYIPLIIIITIYYIIVRVLYLACNAARIVCIQYWGLLTVLLSVRAGLPK
jgi:hypothetical protein